MSSRTSKVLVSFFCFLILSVPLVAQQDFGSINGTAMDSSGASVSQALVKVRNPATNLVQTALSKNDGSFNIVSLPIGTYEVTFSKDGFQTELHSSIFVKA